MEGVAGQAHALSVHTDAAGSQAFCLKSDTELSAKTSCLKSDTVLSATSSVSTLKFPVLSLLFFYVGVDVVRQSLDVMLGLGLKNSCLGDATRQDLRVDTKLPGLQPRRLRRSCRAR